MSTHLTQLMIRMNARYLCAVACICFLIVVLRFIMDISAPAYTEVPASEWNTMTWTNAPATSPWTQTTAWTNRVNPFISPHHRRLILQHRLTKTIERFTEPAEEDPAPEVQEAPVETAAPATAEPRIVRLVYRGAMRLIGPPTIILSAPDMGVEKIMRVGDVFEGLRLTAIEADRATFTHGQTTHALMEGKEAEITIP